MVTKQYRLKDVSCYHTGKVHSRDLNLENYIATTNMLPNKSGVVRAETLPNSEKVNSYSHRDVLISNIRPYFKKIWLANQAGGCDADILNIRADESKILPEYLFNLLSKDEFFDYIMVGTKGVKMPRGDKNFIMDYEFDLPDLDSQLTIANKIMPFWRKVRINNECIEILEEYAQLLFHKWFIDFNFPDENGNPYKDSGGELEEVEGKMIPKGWKFDLITHLGTIIAGGTPSTENSEYFTDNGIPWITPKDLSDETSMYITKGSTDITELGLKNSSANLMPKRTVLMSSRAPIGYLTISRREVTTNQGFKSVVPRDEMFSEFIYYTLKYKMKKIELMSSGSTFSEISKEQFSRLKIIIPPDNLIGEYYLKLKPLFEKISSLYIENQLLKETRDLLIKKLIK